MSRFDSDGESDEVEERDVSPALTVGEGDIDASLRPRSLAEFIGQPRVREQLQLVIEGAKNRGGTPDHILLSGPPGLGKTSLANMIGEYLGGDTSVSRVICSQGDAFETVIRRALSAIKLAMQVPKLGFAAGTSSREFSLWDALPDPAELAADEAG